MHRGALLAGIAISLLYCASADAHSPKVWSFPSHEGDTIGIHAGCQASIRANLRDGSHRTSMEVQGNGGYQIGPSGFGPLMFMEGGMCSTPLNEEENRPEVVEKAPQLRFDGLNLEPKEVVSFRIFINGAAVEGGRVELTREGEAPTRIWEGEDAFVNYCINHNKEITSEGGRLGCFTEGSYQDHGKVVWNHRGR